MQMNKDNFFVPVANTKPYFKAAFEGFAGTGKTYTAAKIAVGLYKRIGSTKPVIIFDTEKASKFLKPLFAQEGIELLVKESKSLADLKETMTRMREGFSDILIIDSISHVWENFLESYKQAPTKYGKSAKLRLEFQDWGIIKPTWKTEFSDLFVGDPYHVVMCGRAGYEYENEVNADTGKREIYKSGVKMKVEGETAYEPDLLVLMERLQEMEGSTVKSVSRRATIIKDRSTVLDGKTFEDPTYEDFAPVIEVMLDSPVKLTTVGECDARDLFKTEDDKEMFRKRKKIVLEEIESYLVQVKPGQDAQSKKFKIDAVMYGFNTGSWTAVEQMHPDMLERGFIKIQEFVQKAVKAEQKEMEKAERTKAKAEKGNGQVHANR